MDEPIPLQTYFAITCGYSDDGQIGYYTLPLTHPATGPLEALPTDIAAIVLFSSRQLCEEFLLRKDLTGVAAVEVLEVTACVDLLIQAKRRGVYSHVTFNPSVNLPAVQEIERFIWSMPERTAENPGSM